MLKVKARRGLGHRSHQVTAPETKDEPDSRPLGARKHTLKQPSELQGPLDSGWGSKSRDLAISRGAPDGLGIPPCCGEGPEP